MDIVDAATKGDLALVLAIGLVTLAGAVAFLFRTIIKVYQERVDRAEKLTDRMVDTFDGLEKATNTAVAVARDNAEIAAKAAESTKIALDELRRK